MPAEYVAMGPIYCSECLERIPLAYFAQGKAIWSGGRPYDIEHAIELGLKPDSVPPVDFTVATGISLKVGNTPPPQKKSREKPMSPDAREGQIGKLRNASAAFAAVGSKCELVIFQDSDGLQPARPPLRIELNVHATPETAVVLGREGICGDIFRSNGRISRRHCMIWLQGSSVMAKDLGSSNNTFLDGVPLIPQKEYPLLPGQLLTLGAKHSATRVCVEATQSEAFIETV